ncbi:hypothetical protein SCHPADRAFT_136378 [Schizopora paradoxa]|uniref:Transcription factor IIIC subunit 5 HTH domain-containing protein n=1 Tax=Schizopora paradoxa TaxID=27342 RepID=A0A0H2S8U8_9AGAM|nr:hypothetical protein SCHPADRAFT_136378 [Schizopora paradoxa]
MNYPEAGPSNTQSSSSKAAPSHPLPSRPFYSVEFPGYVKDSSVPQAVKHIGGQSTLNRIFNPNATKTDMLLELNWRPDNPFSHPISGGVIVSHGILLKVVKKRRKRKDGAAGGEQPQGEFTAEAVGIISRTARFRSMADFQFTPDMTDPVVKLRMAMDNMDVQAICNYTVPPEEEDYGIPKDFDTSTTAPASAASTELPSDPMQRQSGSHLRLLPPPLFSRQIVPHIYNYKQNTMSIVSTTVDEETGAEKKRLVNKSRWVPTGPAQASYSDANVPTEPPQSAQDAKGRADKRILELLKNLFDERPAWTRVALSNQLSPMDSRELTNSKLLLTLACYTFSDGPWRDTLCRFGYDPRKDPQARFYQRIYFRNVNHPIVRVSVLKRRQESRSAILESLSEKQTSSGDDSGNVKSHIFDGVNQTRETATFQLCDIIDPMLKGMIEDEDAVRDECNERDGWYTTHAIERIKIVLRHKYFSILDGHRATDEDCIALLESGIQGGADENSRMVYRDIRRLRPGKHNMAKGAQRPEEAAAIRLRAKLDSNARAALGSPSA